MSKDILDWTITAAPDPDEPPPRPDRPPEMLVQKLPRRHWLLSGTLILGVVLGLGLLTAWNGYWVRWEVRRLIALEEKSALDQDVESIRRLSDARSLAWLNAQVRRARAGQASPLPLPVLRPMPAPGSLQSFEGFAPDTVRADVARQFAAPDGTVVTFALPQFYHYAEGEWRRILPPDTYWGEKKDYSGPHIRLTYPAVEAAFVEKDLGPYLDSVLAQACATWHCPDNLQIHFTFAAEAGQLTDSDVLAVDLPTLRPDEPLLFTLMLSSAPSPNWRDVPGLIWPAPHAMGYPVDKPGAELLKRVIALQALAEAASRMTANGEHTQKTNAFLYALVVRQAARLGLEAPQVLDPFHRSAEPAPDPEASARWQITGPSLEPQKTPSVSRPTAYSLLNLDGMWDWSADGREVTPDLWDGRLRGALLVLNRLLQRQPEEAELHLLHSLSSSFGPAFWLSDGIGIPYEVIQAHVLALSGRAERIEPQSTAHYDFALGCEAGPALFSQGQAAPTYFFARHLVYGSAMSWSPDGRRLVVAVSSQPAVIDFGSGAITWPPGISRTSYPVLRGWISDTVLAYTLSPYQAPSGLDATRVSLNFFDTADPQRQLPVLAGIQDYVLSPDGTTATIVQTRGRESAQDEIGLMPALGGPITPLDAGVAPAWSPDGKALVYTHFDEAGTTFTLRVADPAAHTTRDIFRSDVLGAEAQPAFIQAAWSPTGRLIAFSATAGSNIHGDSHAWLGVVNPDGTQLELLLDEEASVSRPDFSADGKFLAVTLYPRKSQAKTIIYDTTTGQPSLTLPNLWGIQWAPTGHQIVLASYTDLYLITDPGDSQAQPEALVQDECYTILWNPMR